MRQVGVVGKFVEFFGPGVSSLSIADRATISNMCPEYGATVGFFPVDEASMTYLRQTGKLHQICKWYSVSIQLLVSTDHLPNGRQLTRLSSATNSTEM